MASVAIKPHERAANPSAGSRHTTALDTKNRHSLTDLLDSRHWNTPLGGDV